MAGWFSLFLCILGFAALALAMPRHYEQLLFRKPAAGRQWVWRLLALVLLGLSVGLACMAWDNAIIAISAWFGMAAPAAFAVAIALTFRARQAARNSRSLPASYSQSRT